MKKLVFVALVVVLLGAAGFQLYRKIGKKEGGRAGQRFNSPVAVEAAPVERVTLKDIGEFSGSLEPSSQFVVSSKIGGRLERLSVDIGDVVRNGDLIAELEDEEAAQQVEQAKAELEVASASLEDSRNALLLSERKHERTRALQEKQIASIAELDQVEAELRAAEARHKVSLAQIKQKEAELKVAEVRLSYTKIRVTWNGGERDRVIGERFADEGALLRVSDPIVSVLDIDTLVAVIQVIERDYPRVRQGQDAVITTDLFPGREFVAKVVRVAPLIKEAARQAEAKLEVPNPGRLLKPGMFVQVRVEFARREGAITIPIAALVRRNGEQGVFLIDGDEQRVRFVPVQVGLVYEGRAELLDPPLSGMVVTLGHNFLEDGYPIRLSGADEKAGSMEPGGPQEDAKARGDRSL